MAKKKKLSWIEKLKMGATKHIAEKYHSPAGKKYFQRAKKKRAEQKGFTSMTKRELGNLSEADYNAVMKAMGKK